MSEHESIRDGLAAERYPNHDPGYDASEEVMADREAFVTGWDAALAHLAAQATEAGVAEVLAERAYMVSAGKCGHPAVPWADSSEFTRSMWINVATEVAAALAPLLAARAETRTVSAEQVEAAAEARGARGNLVSFLAALGIEVRDAD